MIFVHPAKRKRHEILLNTHIVFGKSKVSAWMLNWFEEPLVEKFAGLRLESDPRIQAEAAALWARQPIGGFRIMLLPGRRVVFLCPP